MEMNDPAEDKELRKERVSLDHSAKTVARSTTELADSADRRTTLAGDRTLLAAERTYAAWVRTALAALASGVGARALTHEVLPEWVGKISGSLLVIFSGFCLIAAVWREIHGTPSPPTPDMRRIPIALLVPMNFFLLLVAIAALVAIWAA
jgi:putative membrane protein